MREATATSLIREARKTRDSVIDHWKRGLRTGTLQERVGDPGKNRMKRFKRYSEEEARQLNELQASYFDRHVHVFDPPLPEGVPERLQSIVRAARIRPSDISGVSRPPLVRNETLGRPFDLA